MIFLFLMMYEIVYRAKNLIAAYSVLSKLEYRLAFQESHFGVPFKTHHHTSKHISKCPSVFADTDTHWGLNI